MNFALSQYTCFSFPDNHFSLLILYNIAYNCKILYKIRKDPSAYISPVQTSSFNEYWTFFQNTNHPDTHCFIWLDRYMNQFHSYCLQIQWNKTFLKQSSYLCSINILRGSTQQVTAPIFTLLVTWGSGWLVMACTTSTISVNLFKRAMGVSTRCFGESLENLGLQDVGDSEQAAP